MTGNSTFGEFTTAAVEKLWKWKSYGQDSSLFIISPFENTEFVCFDIPIDFFEGAFFRT